MRERERERETELELKLEIKVNKIFKSMHKWDLFFNERCTNRIRIINKSQSKMI